MIQSFNYVAAILVVLFGWWLFSGQMVYRPQGVTLTQVQFVSADSPSSSYTSAQSGYVVDSRSYAGNGVYAVSGRVANFVSAHQSTGMSNETQEQVRHPAAMARAISNHGDDVETETQNATVSDDDWFSGLMNRARNFTDRIINISIDGSAASVTGSGEVSDNNTAANSGQNTVESSTETGEENLPQPTESDNLVDNNQVDCNSMQYMGGNAYGRNMLIRMGCTVP